MRGLDIFALAVCAAIGWNLGNAAWFIFLEYLSRLNNFVNLKIRQREFAKREAERKRK